MTRRTESTVVRTATPVGRECRQHPRLRIAPMYSLLRARRVGDSRYRWTGHVYDISQSGMRFELDQPLPADTQLEMRVMLPGKSHVTFQVTGRVIRLHDDEPAQGPVRMGMVFESFLRQTDRQRLEDYLAQADLEDQSVTKVA